MCLLSDCAFCLEMCIVGTYMVTFPALCLNMAFVIVLSFLLGFVFSGNVYSLVLHWQGIC